MIKYNCGGAGLAHGLRAQLFKLVESMKIAADFRRVTWRLQEWTDDQIKDILDPAMQQLRDGRGNPNHRAEIDQCVLNKLPAMRKALGCRGRSSPFACLLQS